jgi:predicted dehydrogenase
LKKKNIRAGVIGLGVGAHQARTLSLHPNIELKWLCDLNKDKLLELNRELPEAKITQNSKDVLQDEDTDLVCIASYDQFHFEQVIIALNNGKHVYVEKPICLSKIETKKIHKKLSEQPNLRLSSNMVLRTCPLFNKVKESINSNMMGKLYYLEADYLWGRKEKLTNGWRAEAELYSIIYGAAVHMVDLVMWLTKKKPLRVQAMGNRISTKGTKQRNNDFAVLLLEFENQMVVKISAHGSCVHPHFHSLKIFGTSSSFFHESTGTVWIESSKPNQKFKVEKEEYPAKSKREGALISFIESLTNANKSAMISQTEVFNTMSVCFAAEKSIKTGKAVEIDYLN